MFISNTPRGPSSAVAALLWLHLAEAPVSARELRLPTGDIDLVINLQDGETVVAGPSSRSIVLDNATQIDTLGVVLKVGYAASLLGLPLSELRDRQLPLAELWKSGAEDLRDRILAAQSPTARFEAIEQVLSERLLRTRYRPHPAAAVVAARIAAAPERCRIAELSDEFGLSSRRLEQVVRTDVGLSLKSYQRLQRFRRALVRIDAAARAGWAVFALDRGYYDQSHFVNEFRAHAGLTPSAYLASRGPSLNHVPLVSGPSVSSNT